MGKLAKDSARVSRRAFLASGAAAGGAAALGALAPTEANAQNVVWNRQADIVIVGAGVSGLSAANEAGGQGASLIPLEKNYDIGGPRLLRGGQLHPAGGD